jgi:hypothetical protein
MIRVPDAGSYDLVGPYLSRRAKCPVCGKLNILLHMESYSSPIRPEKQTCWHLLAVDWDDDGNGFFEFEGEAETVNGEGRAL